MATLRVINSKSECVAEALTPQSFVDFKRRCANEGVGRIALIVTLDCGEQLFMDTCKLLKRLPKHPRRPTRGPQERSGAPQGHPWNSPKRPQGAP